MRRRRRLGTYNCSPQQAVLSQNKICCCAVTLCINKHDSTHSFYLGARSTSYQAKASHAVGTAIINSMFVSYQYSTEEVQKESAIMYKGQQCRSFLVLFSVSCSRRLDRSNGFITSVWKIINSGPQLGYSEGWLRFFTKILLAFINLNSLRSAFCHSSKPLLSCILETVLRYAKILQCSTGCLYREVDQAKFVALRKLSF